MYHAPKGCIDMVTCILKKMRILTMRRVGGTGFTYQNEYGMQEIPMYRATFLFLTIQRDKFLSFVLFTNISKCFIVKYCEIHVIKSRNTRTEIAFQL